MADINPEWQVAATVGSSTPPIEPVTSDQLEEILKHIPRVTVRHDSDTGKFHLVWRVNAPDDLQTITTQAMSHIITAFAAVFRQKPTLLELFVTRESGDGE